MIKPLTCNRPTMPAPKFETFSVSKTFVRVDTKGAFYMQRAGTAAVAFRYRLLQNKEKPMINMRKTIIFDT